jgi:hypothetical protein
MDNLSQSLQNSNIEFCLSSAISRSDIKQLANIHVEALKDDASAALKFADRDEFRVKIEQMLEGQVRINDGTKSSKAFIKQIFSLPDINDWFIVKATLKSFERDDQPEKIIGWASWLYENPIPDEWTEGQSSISNKQEGDQDSRKLLHFNQRLGALSVSINLAFIPTGVKNIGTRAITLQEREYFLYEHVSFFQNISAVVLVQHSYAMAVSGLMPFFWIHWSPRLRWQSLFMN